MEFHCENVFGSYTDIQEKNFSLSATWKNLKSQAVWNVYILSLPECLILAVIIHHC